MTLSLAMIVKNESKNLGKCLDSVYGLADEIIIVDTGSTDDTVEIAKRHGAQVSHAPWSGDFAEMRNIALSKCRSDWVLILDADEAITNHDAVREAMKSPYDAIVFDIRNYFSSSFAILFDQMMVPNDGKYFPEYPNFGVFPALRMFRNNLGFSYRGRIHEQLCKHDGDRIVSVAKTEAIIHHFGKVDVERELKKKDEYFNAAKLQSEEDSDNPQAWFNLMAQASVRGDAKEAICASMEYLKLVDDPSVVVLSTLAMALQSEERHQEALGYLVKALEREPNHALSMCRFAISLCMLGKTQDAVDVCEFASENHPQFVHIDITWAECELFRGNFEEAIQILKRAIQNNPHEEKMLSEKINSIVEMRHENAR